MIDCNWLQPMENSVDPSHLFWLHGDTERYVPAVKTYAESYEFVRFEYGIRKRRTTLPQATGGAPAVDDHPLLFPTILRHGLNRIVDRWRAGTAHHATRGYCDFAA